MKKRIIAFLLMVILTVGGLGAGAEEAEKEIVRVTVSVERADDHVTIANPTQLKGNFFSDLWDSATSDIDVREILHGYNLVRFDGEMGTFTADENVVSGVASTENAAGDKSYIIALYSDLYYSDGTKITAWDYAFSLLFEIDLQINDLGGVASRQNSLLGYDDYINATSLLKNTEYTERDGQFVEKVLTVRLEDRDGEAVYADIADVLAGRQGMTLQRNDANELTLWDGTGKDRLVHVDAEGIITDWHYENGVRVWKDGTHGCLAGVRVIADDMLMITIDHEYLPYFYEMGLLSCKPYPISVIAPGVAVRDDGQGVYLANAENEGDAPVFTTALLRETVLDEETGYLRNPKVVSGPYQLTSFDGVTAEFAINPLYKGDYLGRKPSIQFITYTLADNATMVEKLATGEFDVLNKVTKETTLDEAFDLLEKGTYTTVEERGENTLLETEYVSRNGYHMVNYNRTGLSFVAFCCERETVSSQAVRQAIAWCMDRDKLTEAYTGGYGQRVDGYYGLGQWMYKLVTGQMEYPVEENPGDPAAYAAEIAAWESLSLNGLTAYTVDLDRARRLLDQDGWKLNDDGLREKDGVTLDLVAYPEGNEIAECFEEYLVKNLEQVGIRLTLVAVPMVDLLQIFYRLPLGENASEIARQLYDGESLRQIDLLFLATNFSMVFDPSVFFMVEDRVYHWSGTANSDEVLYRLAVDMRRTEPGDVLGYVEKWIAFEHRFNESLPMIPVYSNYYYDFCIGELQGYNVNEWTTCGQALLGATLGQEAETEAPKMEKPGE